MNECRPLHPRESFDLLLVDLIAVAGVALALMGDAPSGLVRTVVMVPLVLLLPGYALTAAVDPEWRFDVPERLVLTLGGSLVVATLGGLVLNWTAWGLQAGSWAALLAGTTLSASALALRRRQRVRPADPMQWCRSLELRQVLLAALAVLATAAALQIARVGAAREPTSGFTQLWLLPDANQHLTRLGIHSMELAPTTFVLRVAVDGSVIQEWPSISLQPGESWIVDASLPEATGGSVTATLYREESLDVPYRHVQMWASRSGA